MDALRRFAGNYQLYHAAYADYKAAVRVVLLNAPFSGPDVIGKWEWITNFVNAESNHMRLLTQHYYRGGARDPSSTKEKLLQQSVESKDGMTFATTAVSADGVWTPGAPENCELSQESSG